MTPPEVRVGAEPLTRFTAAVLETCGVQTEHAELTAEVLVAADLAGIESHGVSRLGLYVHKLDQGLVTTDPRPQVVHETSATCLVDADNGLGPVGSLLATDWCIERATQTGLACASVRRSNHFGIAGYWSRRMLDHGLIGVAMTNATCLVAPTFGREPRFGTNPISVAVPAAEGRPFVLDMATSTVSAGALQLAMARGEPIPEGWALDGEGQPTTDPAAGFGGALVPLGSTPELRSYKGYGLGVVVDVLSALLSGANYGPHCLSLTSEFDSVANVGHFFLALQVDAFRPLAEFGAVVDEMVDGLRATPAADDEQVLVAGDPEAEAREDRERHGIPMLPTTLDALRRLADERGLDRRYAELVGEAG